MYLVMETRKVNNPGSSLKAPECCLYLSHVFSYMYGIKEDHENSIILLYEVTAKSKKLMKMRFHFSYW